MTADPVARAARERRATIRRALETGRRDLLMVPARREGDTARDHAADRLLVAIADALVEVLGDA